MFEKTRLKLTVWYLVIIIVISMLFSIVIYSGVNEEFRHLERVQERIKERQEERLPIPLNSRPRFDPEIINQSRIRVITILGGINIAILFLAGFSGYFLAGRTLKPIKKMLEEQNRFIADASHELRTPLTSLKTSIEVNLRNKNLTPEKAKELIKSNLEEVNNLQILSDNLIRLAQYQKTNNNFIIESISITEVIDSAISKVSPLAQSKDTVINKEVEQLRIKGDKKSLIELLIILLDNAIKYSPSNSVIKITAIKTDNHVEITISDKGIGIKDRDIEYIFDRFYRAEKSRSKEVIPGYGLGLSIAKKILDMHDGTINVKSEINKGTTFIIKLPLSI